MAAFNQNICLISEILPLRLDLLMVSSPSCRLKMNQSTDSHTQSMIVSNVTS